MGELMYKDKKTEYMEYVASKVYHFIKIMHNTHIDDMSIEFLEDVYGNIYIFNAIVINVTKLNPEDSVLKKEQEKLRKFKERNKMNAENIDLQEKQAIMAWEDEVGSKFAKNMLASVSNYRKKQNTKRVWKKSGLSFLSNALSKLLGKKKGKS